jgi:deoxyribonuclease V
MTEHEWQLTPAEAIALQKQLAGRVRLMPLPGEVRLVAGVDCSFPSREEIIAGAVLCDAATMDVLAERVIRQSCVFPYISGLLSFREAPAVIEAVGALPERPDLLLCDGQGLAHPRGLGLASHVGLWVDLPTVGVAKSRLCGDYRTPGQRRGCATRLRLAGRTIGKVVRTRDGVRPLFVSPGHRITLDEAVRWTLQSGRGFRLPEPTRQADRLVARARREPG